MCKNNPSQPTHATQPTASFQILQQVGISMAMLGFRSLALLVGAGYTGSFLYNNMTMERARKIATDILKRHEDAHKNSNSSPSDSSSSLAASASAAATKAVDNLAERVDRLTREVSHGRSDPVVIVGQSGYKQSIAAISDIFNLLGWTVFVFTIGGLVYFVAVRKKISLKDLFWVSQTRFNDTISSMQAGMSKVSGVVNSVRKDLGNRLGRVEGKVEQVEQSLSCQIEEQVGEVKDGVNNLSIEVSDVKRGVDNVNQRVGEMSDKLDSTVQGIHLLLSVVSSLAPKSAPPGTPVDLLRQYMSGKSAPIEINGPLVRPRISQTGLGTLVDGDNDRASTGSLHSLNKRHSIDVSSPAWSVG